MRRKLWLSGTFVSVALVLAAAFGRPADDAQRSVEERGPAPGDLETMRKIPLSESAGPLSSTDWQDLAMLAVSGNPDGADRAVRLLREAGPAGLEALLSAHRERLERSGDRTDPAWQRLQAALDTVAGQRDSHASRLYWHTDLERAKATARAEGKPILSLRLLGNLTDEYSCANSRFFRTTLYPNAQVGRVLRERFVLHWESVRPVPRVTIDFGDGRRLERTLTGNSIHYVLDTDGRPLDALPGLYGPRAFVRVLEQSEQLARALEPLSGTEWETALTTWHRERGEQIRKAIQADLMLGRRPRQDAATFYVPARNNGEPPRALEAGEIARGKSIIERPLLLATSTDPVERLTEASDEVWSRLAELHIADAELDAASLALIRRKLGTAGSTGTGDPLAVMLPTLLRSIATDTVRNEYLLHRTLHEWFASGEAHDLDRLNRRVYAELFLTPDSDPWLGLLPADVYTALDDNGVVLPQAGE